MDQTMMLHSTGESSRVKPERDASSVDSSQLMAGRRELLIRHGASTYRLRVTASEKLILTK
ncbi:hemin uptake protein HemP [Reyranella aquatilis]|jgi:hemin uptake protein HemP|uniref:Hemin uptake protein HemP n=2 Tax=Reyranella TaxID=445219 RepID=A0ABS8KPV2_9HYPH|nr:hemin uptake protein HemP [Reyranella aquatilis]MCC8428111.1 hemin uptake protein HemP [Reyranella aquatilis]